MNEFHILCNSRPTIFFVFIDIYTDACIRINKGLAINFIRWFATQPILETEFEYKEAWQQAWINRIHLKKETREAKNPPDTMHTCHLLVHYRA